MENTTMDTPEEFATGRDNARTNFASTELLLAFPEHHISWVRVNPTVGNYDRSDKALKIRDERYFEAVSSIRDLIQNPRTEIVYLGYQDNQGNPYAN
jgi:hypothetical protein